MDPWIEQAAAEIGRRAPRGSSRRSWRSPRPRATCTARTSARRCAPRWCPTRRRSSGCRAPRPATPRTWSRACTAPARGRVLLLGHVDTVVAHAEHKPLKRVGEQLLGSGSVDMKGGDILAIGALRAFAAARALRRGSRCCWSATRSGGRRRSATSSASRASTRACASRPASWPATTRASWCGARPPGRSTSPATGAARTRARRPTAAATRCSRSPPPPRPSPLRHDPQDGSGPPDGGADRDATRATRSTSCRAPVSCTATCAPTTSTRSRRGAAVRSLEEVGGARLEAELIRRWPGMQLRGRLRAPLLERAERSARPPHGARRQRGGASDASHFAADDPDHDRRPRPARRQGAQPRGVRPRELAAGPRRGRSRAHRRVPKRFIRGQTPYVAFRVRRRLPLRCIRGSGGGDRRPGMRSTRAGAGGRDRATHRGRGRTCGCSTARPRALRRGRRPPGSARCTAPWPTGERRS